MVVCASDPGGGSGRLSIDSAVLRAVLTQSPLGLQVLDPDLRLMRFNTAAPGVRGLLGEEVIGRPIREVAPGVVDDALERMLRDVLDTGRPVIDVEHAGRPPPTRITSTSIPSRSTVSRTAPGASSAC